MGGGRTSGARDTASCLTARGVKQDFEVETFVVTAAPPDRCGFDVAHTLRAGGADASEDGTGRGVPIVFDCRGTEVSVRTDGAAPTLRAMAHADSHASAGGHLAIAIQERAVSDTGSGPGGLGISAEGVAYTLEARSTPQSVTAFDLRGREGGAMPEGPHDTANLRAASGGSSRSYVAGPAYARRLSPRECERLMGFPDDWTRVPVKSYARPPKGSHFQNFTDQYDVQPDGAAIRFMADGPRYTMIGNSWAVNVARWIGEGIAAVETLASEGAL